MVHSADEKLLRTKDVVIHMSSEKRKKCRCCEKRLMALPVIGFTLFSIACLLGVGYFSVRRVTSSVYHTEGVVPSYAIAGLVSRLYCFVCFQIAKCMCLMRKDSVKYGFQNCDRYDSKVVYSAKQVTGLFINSVCVSYTKAIVKLL